MERLKNTYKEISYIPALPGYSTIELTLKDEYPGDSRFTTYMRPIIGWEVAGDTVNPITIEGVDKDNAIVFPDGRVELPFMYRYDSVSKWMQGEVPAKVKAREEERNSSSAPSPPSAAVPDTLG